MRESVGGVSIFNIAIVFILLFAGIMALTINSSKAFGVKDEIINLIENYNDHGSARKEQPLTDKVKEGVADYLSRIGYRTSGTCPDGYVSYDHTGKIIRNSRVGTFCIKYNDVTDSYEDEKKCGNGSKCSISNTTNKAKLVYYDVIVFYQLDIPVLNQLLSFKLSGATKVVTK